MSVNPASKGKHFLMVCSPSPAKQWPKGSGRRGGSRTGGPPPPFRRSARMGPLGSLNYSGELFYSVKTFGQFDSEKYAPPPWWLPTEKFGRPSSQLPSLSATAHHWGHFQRDSTQPLWSKKIWKIFLIPLTTSRHVTNLERLFETEGRYNNTKTKKPIYSDSIRL